MRRGDATDASYEDRLVADWLWPAVLPLVAFVVGVAIVVGLVLSGAVQGHKTYAAPKAAPTTEQTLVIQP